MAMIEQAKRCLAHGVAVGDKRNAGPAPLRRLGVLAVLLLFIAGALGCSPTTSKPTRLQLVDLARFPDRYDDQRVSTTGTVHTYSSPRHYWIQTSDDDRVAVHPGDRVASLVGERVRVVGRFRYSQGQGRSIAIDTVTRLEQ